MKSLLAALLLLPGLALAQGIDMSQGGPTDITADDGIEWRQNDQVVIAGATDMHTPSESGERAWKDAILCALEEHRFELAPETLKATDGSPVAASLSRVAVTAGSFGATQLAASATIGVSATRWCWKPALM